MERTSSRAAAIIAEHAEAIDAGYGTLMFASAWDAYYAALQQELRLTRSWQVVLLLQKRAAAIAAKKHKEEQQRQAELQRQAAAEKAAKAAAAQAAADAEEAKARKVSRGIACKLDSILHQDIPLIFVLLLPAGAAADIGIRSMHRHAPCSGMASM